MKVEAVFRNRKDRVGGTMNEMLFRGLMVAVVSWPLFGCSSGIEPAPQGYHHEWVDNGKRKEMITVPDDPSAGKPPTMVVRSNTDQPGPGDYYIYITEGKQVTRVLVHNEEVKAEGKGQWIEVAPDQICPNCKPYYKMVGKQMERSFYCNSSVHVPPGKKKES